MKKLGKRSNQWDIALTVDDRSICYLVDSNTEVAVGQNYRNWDGGLLRLEPFPGSYDSSWYDCSKDIPPYIYVPKFPGYYEGCDIRQYFKKNAVKYRNHKPDPANDLKFKVTQVAQWAFYNAQYVPVVTLPETIVEIEKEAFWYCWGMDEIHLKEGLKIIGDNAFSFCLHLQEITIPDSVDTIGEGAFGGCFAMSRVVIGRGVKTLIKTFSGCSRIKEVTCRALTPPSMEGNVFDDSVYQSAVLKVPIESMEAYKKHSDWGKFKKIESFGSLPKVGDTFKVQGLWFQVMTDSDVCVAPIKEGQYGFKELNVPSRVTYGNKTYNVTGIGKAAFDDNECIRTVTLPDPIKIICYAAFRNTPLEKITFPDSLKIIEDEAFLFCKGLKKIDIPGSVVSIGENAFGEGCENLESVTLHEGLQKIGDYAFYETFKLPGLIIPNGVKEIGKLAFENSGYNSGRKWDLKIPDSVTSIGSGAFSGSNVRKVTLPKPLTVIEDRLFDYADLQELHICEKVTRIGKQAFTHNNNNLQRICLSCPPPEVEGDAFDAETFKNARLEVPASALNAYKSHPIWGKFKEIVGIGADNRPVAPSDEIKPVEPSDDSYFMFDGIRYIVKNAEAKEVWMTTLPDEEEYKGDLVIPPSVTYRDETYAVVGIDENACDGCDELLSVVIPSSVVSVGEFAFSGSRNLARLKLHNGLVKIGKSAFSQLPALTSLTIPDTVREIGPTAFAYIGTGVNYTKVKAWDIIIPDNVVSLGAGAFLCSGKPSNFRRVILGRGLKRIEDRTFDNSKMNELFIPDTVKEIGTEAFISYKNNLKIITCMASNPPRLEEKVFSDETFLSATLKVPASALDAYKADAQWGKFKKIEAVS